MEFVKKLEKRTWRYEVLVYFMLTVNFYDVKRKYLSVGFQDIPIKNLNLFELVCYHFEVGRRETSISYCTCDKRFQMGHTFMMILLLITILFMLIFYFDAFLNLS